METMQPTLKRGRNVWNRINMPETEFKDRIYGITQKMKSEGIDVLFLYGKDNQRYGDPCYVSNFVRRMPQEAIVLLTQKGEVALVFEGSSRDTPAAKVTTWVSDIRCGDVVNQCVEFLKERNLIPSTIGSVGLNLMPNFEFQPLKMAFGHSTIVDAGHILRDMRMVKSQRECDEVRRSARILSGAFDLISDKSLQPGNERNLAAILDRASRLEGAEDVRVLLAKPKDKQWAFRPADDTRIFVGDTIIVYLSVEFERYWSEGIRTFTIEPSGAMIPVDSSAVYKHLLDKMASQKKISEFYKEALNEIQLSGVEFISEFGLGHGIGLGIDEFPVIKENGAGQFLEGMCFTLHLAVKDREKGAVMIGNTIILSGNGAEVVS